MYLEIFSGFIVKFVGNFMVCNYRKNLEIYIRLFFNFLINFLRVFDLF